LFGIPRRSFPLISPTWSQGVCQDCFLCVSTLFLETRCRIECHECLVWCYFWWKLHIQVVQLFATGWKWAHRGIKQWDHS